MKRRSSPGAGAPSAALISALSASYKSQCLIAANFELADEVVVATIDEHDVPATKTPHLDRVIQQVWDRVP